jgi:hypothetical protein
MIICRSKDESGMAENLGLDEQHKFSIVMKVRGFCYTYGTWLQIERDPYCLRNSQERIPRIEWSLLASAEVSTGEILGGMCFLSENSTPRQQLLGLDNKA